MWDTIKFFFQYELLDFFKTSIVGDVALGAAFVNWLAAKYTNLPATWRQRVQGAACAFLLIAVVVAGQFFYGRWSLDPRELPADRIEAFRTALGPSDNSQFVSVFCFKGDSSSCAIASKYRNLFADYWSLRLGPQYETDPNCPPELINRIWVYTEYEHDRPNGAKILHKALDEAGMNPGYRRNSAMGPTDFGFAVGCSH